VKREDEIGVEKEKRDEGIREEECEKYEMDIK
jgi:hypothetical protein